MATSEFWLSGPIQDIPSLLQPVAHAILQARREIEETLATFPSTALWQQPKGVASVGFHLRHIPGVLDRLFTYARGEQLNEQQLNYLKQESVEDISITTEALLQMLRNQVEAALIQLKQTESATLTDVRGVGRKQIPSNVIGLLFHAAEHTMRHTGQLLVTARMVGS